MDLGTIGFIKENLTEFSESHEYFGEGTWIKLAESKQLEPLRIRQWEISIDDISLVRRLIERGEKYFPVDFQTLRVYTLLTAPFFCRSTLIRILFMFSNDKYSFDSVGLGLFLDRTDTIFVVNDVRLPNPSRSRNWSLAESSISLP